MKGCHASSHTHQATTDSLRFFNVHFIKLSIERHYYSFLNGLSLFYFRGLAHGYPPFAIANHPSISPYSHSVRCIGQFGVIFIQRELC